MTCHRSMQGVCVSSSYKTAKGGHQVYLAGPAEMLHIPGLHAQVASRISCNVPVGHDFQSMTALRR